MPVKVVAADPRVKEDEGKRAIQRGPLVYCMEEVDNRSGFYEWHLDENTTFELANDSILPGDMKIIQAHNGDKTAVLIPYYAWDNREAGPMKVWIDYTNN